MIFASWGPLGKPVGGLLGASWRPLGPSGDHLGRLGAIFRRFGALLDRLDGLPGRPWAVWGPSWARGPSRRPTRETPEAPKSARESGGVGPKETTILDLSGLHEPWGTPLRAKGTVADYYYYDYYYFYYYC